jgi:hypothetical protein
MAKPPHVCTQRLLPADLMRYQSTVRRGGGTRAAIPLGKLWMNGSTRRVRFIGGTAAQRAKAKEQAAWWTQSANLTFDFNDAPDAELRVAFDGRDGAWSFDCTDNRGIPLDQPAMNLSFMDGGTVAHQFGHAIGLAHEHQNPAGGIEWNEGNVIRDLRGPTNCWTEAMIRHNVLLSATDKACIARAKACPKAAPTIIDAREIKVAATRCTSASIGKVGEEDLPRFRIGAAGTHGVDRRRPTDAVMKLFGPDSATDVIAEDDDSGVETSALMRPDRVPGQYYAQVRHCNRANWMGKYTMKVRRA